MIDRPHYVRLGSNRSNLVICCTEAPQGAALSPFLFTFYNSGSHSTYRNTLKILQRCMSDGQEEEYRALVDDFVSSPQLKPWQRGGHWRKPSWIILTILIQQTPLSKETGSLPNLMQFFTLFSKPFRIIFWGVDLEAFYFIMNIMIFIIN